MRPKSMLGRLKDEINALENKTVTVQMLYARFGTPQWRDFVREIREQIIEEDPWLYKKYREAAAMHGILEKHGKGLGFEFKIPEYLEKAIQSATKERIIELLKVKPEEREKIGIPRTVADYDSGKMKRFVENKILPALRTLAREGKVAKGVVLT